MTMGNDQGSRSDLSPWVRDYVCGCVAGAVNVFVGYPFDTVKVTVQNSSPGRFAGPVDCCSHILASRGVRPSATCATSCLYMMFYLVLVYND